MSIYDQCLPYLCSDHVHIWSMSSMPMFWPCPYSIQFICRAQFHKFVSVGFTICTHRHPCPKTWHRIRKNSQITIYDQCLPCLCSDHVQIWSMSSMSMFWPCPYMINVFHVYVLTMSIYDQCLPCLCSDHVHIWSMSSMSMFWPCPYMINVFYASLLTMSIYDQCLLHLYSDHVHIWSMSSMPLFCPSPYMDLCFVWLCSASLPEM